MTAAERTGKTRKTATYWIKFYVDGKPKEEPTGTTKFRAARKLLRRRLGEVASGRYVPIETDKIMFTEIQAMGLNHYRANDRRSLDRFEDAVIHLAQLFSLSRVRDITPDRITAYVAARKQDGAANATINRELAALKLMLRLGERAGKVVNRPYIAMLEEKNTRKGFFEEDQFQAVLANLSDDLKPAVEVAYITGWRLRSEIFTRQRSHLDLRAGWLRLEPGETKNGEGRMFPLEPRLRADDAGDADPA